MSTKISKAQQVSGSVDPELPPKPPYNFDVDTSSLDLVFPPDADQDIDLYDGSPVSNEDESDIEPEGDSESDFPEYVSPFINGTNIPVDDREGILMALINGDIALTAVRKQLDAPVSKYKIGVPHTQRIPTDEDFMEEMAVAVKADRVALAALQQQKEDTEEAAKREADLAKVSADMKSNRLLAERQQLLKPSKVVFHSVPVVKGKDELDIVEYAKLVGVKLRLCKVPESTIFETLYNEFPWMQSSIAYLENSCLMAKRGNGILKFSPLLLLGASGVGKTSLARRFCELSDIPYIVLSAGGSADSMLIKGLHRGWTSAQAGSVVNCIKQYTVANPVIIIDEIDKASTNSANGSLIDSLIQMLEPSSASVWQDEYLQGRVDLSSVNFIMTANEITKLSGPLLSRSKQITVDYLTQKNLQHAIPRMLVEIAESYGINSKTIPIMDDTVAKAITRKCSDLRKLKLAVQTWLLVALKQEDEHIGCILH